MALRRLGMQQLGVMLDTLQQQGAVQALVHCQQLAACASTQTPSPLALAPPHQQHHNWGNRTCNSNRSLSSSSTSSSTAGTASSSSAGSNVAAKESLQQVRARIFEQHIGDGRRSGRKAILRPLKGRHIASWYFTLTNPKLPMLQDEIEEERILKVQTARATGGGPPKKGQGKRAGKKR